MTLEAGALPQLTCPSWANKNMPAIYLVGLYKDNNAQSVGWIERDDALTFISK
jgi:hypothetical protein